MTTPVLFLVGAIGLSVVLGVGVWLFSRPRKQKFGSSIDAFHNDLSALAPRKESVYQQPAHRQGPRSKPGPRPRSS